MNLERFMEEFAIVWGNDTVSRWDEDGGGGIKCLLINHHILSDESNSKDMILLVL
jgi:hypothetical protein